MTGGFRKPHLPGLKKDRMIKTELAKQIRAVSYLTGEFVLRSGNISNFYWDKYRFESNPVLLTAIAEEMAKYCPRNATVWQA